MELEELVSRAQVAFREIQNEMNALAPLVAREQGLAAGDYRGVLRALKAKQFTGDAILPHYQQRMRELEAIIVRERIVSLPARAAQIRLASAGETAAQPAPHMQPPRLIGNTGERGTFVLPLAMTASPGQQAMAYDDFTFEAASWTLTAHEGRPGHELQFAAIVEQGVDRARAVRLQQRQRRGLGALHGGRGETVRAAGWTTGRAPAPAAAPPARSSIPASRPARSRSPRRHAC